MPSWHENGEKVVLVRLETSPEDIEGMAAAEGILTVRGGMTSHAAVVARGMGTCCVSGCGDIKMNEEAKEFELAGHVIKEGDYISIDGSTGNIYGEAIPTVAASISGDFDRFMKWADARRTLRSAPTLILPVTPPRLWPLAPRHRSVPYRAHVLRGRPH